jgi:hypothetical protein
VPGSEIDENNLPAFSTKNINPNVVASLLLALARELDKRGKELDDLEEAYVKAAEAHNVAHTQAFLKARQSLGPDDKPNPQYVCEMMADDASKDERLAMNIAQSKVKAHKRSIEIIGERIKVGQTASATLRQELDLDRIPRGR